MAYDGRLMAAAAAELEKIRENNRSEQARRTAQIYSLIPEIESIDRQLR